MRKISRKKYAIKQIEKNAKEDDENICLKFCTHIFSSNLI